MSSFHVRLGFSVFVCRSDRIPFVLGYQGPFLRWQVALQLPTLSSKLALSGYDSDDMTFLLFPVLGVVVYALIALYRLATHPLRKVPGPWQARISRFWELNQVRANHFEHVNIKLHDKYGEYRETVFARTARAAADIFGTGPIVRTAPNRYSINYPEATQQIYGHGSKFIKDRWYRAYGHPDDAHADIFSVIDERRHAVNRRKVASLFSMTSLVAYEPYVDTSNATLMEKFSEFATTGQAISIPDWMQYYAFDVVGEFTVSKHIYILNNHTHNDLSSFRLAVPLA
jgi:hypothetical protein